MPASFILHLQTMLYSIWSESSVVILGDFNQNILSKKTPIQTIFLQNNFKQIITKVTTTYRSLLDHAYVKNCEVVYSDVYDMYFSDHDLIVFGENKFNGIVLRLKNCSQ